MKKRLLIWGIEGVGRKLVNTILSLQASPYAEIGFIYDGLEAPEDFQFRGIKILGNRSILTQFSPEHTHIFPAATTPATRKLLAEFLLDLGFEIPNIIDPRALIRPETQLGQGCFIDALAYIDALSQISNYCLIGSGATIGHDTTIGSYCSVYTGARVLGHTHLEEGVVLGAQTVLMNHKSMGAWSKAQIGSVIFEDVPPFTTVGGNPAQVLKRYSGPPPRALFSIDV